MGLLLESFDDALWADRCNVIGSPAVSGTYGLHGNGIKLGDDDATAIYYALPGTSGKKHFIGFNLNMQDRATGEGRFIEWNGSNSCVRWLAGNQIQLFVNANPDIYYTSDVLSADEWHYIEFEMEEGFSSDGTVGMWVDGVQVNRATNVDYINSITTEVLFGGTAFDNPDQMWMDDFYLLDPSSGNLTSRLGPIEVVPLLPNGNGNSSDLVGQDSNSTDNYLNVDEATPDDGTTYNGGSTEGDHDTYAMENLTGTPTVVAAVASMYAAKVGSGAKFFRHKCRSNSVDYNGASVGLSESYTLLTEETWDQDPNTSAAWTYTALNAAEFGAEVRDS